MRSFMESDLKLRAPAVPPAYIGTREDVL
jgi:hypothetical protein